MGRTKNITYIQTPISMTLPNGKVKYFSNSRKALTFFDKYYANLNKEMLIGTTEDGLYRYKQPRIFFPKKTSNILRNIAEDLVNKGWFPSEYPNLLGYAFFNPEKGLVLNDLGETGYGLVGRLLFGKSGIGDALVLPIPEFVMDMKKCGGRLIQKPNYLKKLLFGGLLGVFASYVPNEISTIKKSYRLLDMIPLESMDFIGMDLIDTLNQQPIVIKVKSPNKKIVLNDEEDILETIESQETLQLLIATPSHSVRGLTDKLVNELMRMDIEDLLRLEKITSINGKPIKFGNKGLRPANATFGAKYSNHKKRDPYTGNAMARDISIVGGTYKDYADFRAKLLSNPRVVLYMAVRGWGIINELTSQALKKTRGTGPHFHFGPDTWAKRTWLAWLNNPNVSVTKLF